MRKPRSSARRCRAESGSKPYLPPAALLRVVRSRSASRSPAISLADYVKAGALGRAKITVAGERSEAERRLVEILYAQATSKGSS